MILARPDSFRRGAEISTTALDGGVTRVATPETVLGYVRADHDAFVALRGRRLESAEQVGRYPTHGLALEAVRLRKRTI